jgi:hypothetical protein
MTDLTVSLHYAYPTNGGHEINSNNYVRTKAAIYNKTHQYIATFPTATGWWNVTHFAVWKNDKMLFSGKFKLYSNKSAIIGGDTIWFVFSLKNYE